QEDGSLVRNIILFSVLVYELVGPLLTKKALEASGDITEKPQEVEDRRQNKLLEVINREIELHGSAKWKKK
ncbi:MAG: hypothetical protein IJL59_09010, partial [Clostridia bacterium]|nr:hypothetical protein [Clostridia bacterium]